MKEKRWKQLTGKALAAFLIMMIAGTVLSRAADSFLVAKVLTAQPTGKGLTFRYSGIGEIVAEQEQGIYPFSGLIVEEVLVQTGAKIESGTPLFRYEGTSLKKALENAETARREQELVMLELQERKQQSDAETDRKNRETEKKIKEAEKAYTNAEEAVREAEEDLLRLKNEHAEELWQNKRKELALAEEVLSDAEIAAEEGLTDAARQRVKAEGRAGELQEDWDGTQALINRYADLVNDPGGKYSEKQDVLKQLQILMYGGSEAWQRHQDEIAGQVLSGNQLGLTQVIRKDTVLERELRAYAKEQKEGEKNEAVWIALFTKEGLEAKREELAAAKEVVAEALEEEERTRRRLDRAVVKAEKSRDEILQVLTALEDGTYDDSRELAAGQRALEETRKAAEEAEEIWKEVLEDAKDVSENASGSLSGSDGSVNSDTPLEEKIARERSALAQESLAKLEKEIEQLKSLVEQDGIYQSEFAGTVTECSLEEGMTYAGGQSAFRVGTGELAYLAEVSGKADGQVQTGDELMLRFTGRSKDIIGTVAEVSRERRDGETILKVKADLPEGEDYPAGSQAEYTLEKKSDYYQTCIPLSALREDSDGKFVYVLRERERILGKELYVVRVDATLLEQDGSMAAVEGMLTEQDEVVTSSSRMVSEGDRVRRK